jgi:threonine/homoserine efflux transporter RhtA
VATAVTFGIAHVDVYGIACGVVAGGCFGVYTVSAKRLIHDNVNMQAAVPVTLLLGGLILVSVSWSPRRRQASNARRLPAPLPLGASWGRGTRTRSG